MIEADLRNHLINDPAVNAIIGSRMFLKKPIDQQTQPYLTFSRPVKTRDMVSEENRFRIIAFSKDTEQLEILAAAIIDSLEGKTLLNNNFYYRNSFLAQTDSEEKLADGFFWSILTFRFKHTT